MSSLKKNHDGICNKWSEGKCPCLTCKLDWHTGAPATATKCCDLVNHRSACKDETPCLDYEPEKRKRNAIRNDTNRDDAT